jgi:hypothetical protein
MVSIREVVSQVKTGEVKGQKLKITNTGNHIARKKIEREHVDKKMVKIDM